MSCSRTQHSGSSSGPVVLNDNINQLTVMCRPVMNVRCQKECVESKLNGQIDSRSDYSAHLWVV